MNNKNTIYCWQHGQIKRLNNGLNEFVSEFICDLETDLANMKKSEDGVTIGSTVICLENKTKYMLSVGDLWLECETPKADLVDGVVSFSQLSSELSPAEEDLRFPVTRAYINPATSKPDYDATNIGLLFPQNDATELIQVVIQMPHGWQEGTDIESHVHVVQSASQQVVFKMDYKWYNIGEAVPASWTTYTMNTWLVTTAYTVPRHNIIKGSAKLSGAGKTASSILKVKLYRDDNVYVGDILMSEFDVHYKHNKFGKNI